VSCGPQRTRTRRSWRDDASTATLYAHTNGSTVGHQLKWLEHEADECVQDRIGKAEKEAVVMIGAIRQATAKPTGQLVSNVQCCLISSNQPRCNKRVKDGYKGQPIQITRRAKAKRKRLVFADYTAPHKLPLGLLLVYTCRNIGKESLGSSRVLDSMEENTSKHRA